MTRKSKRELERAIEALDSSHPPRTPTITDYFAADTFELADEPGYCYLDGELVELPPGWAELNDR